MRVRNHLLFLLVILSLVFSINTQAQAQVTVVRGGSENPVVTIGKSTFYGGATGLLLGLALTLVIEEDTGDILKWSFVGGTFGGFLLGIYHVANRPQPSSALLQFDSGKLVKLNVPKPRVTFTRDRSVDFKVPIASFSL